MLFSLFPIYQVIYSSTNHLLTHPTHPQSQLPPFFYTLSHQFIHLSLHSATHWAINPYIYLPTHEPSHRYINPPMTHLSTHQPTYSPELENTYTWAGEPAWQVKCFPWSLKIRFQSLEPTMRPDFLDLLVLQPPHVFCGLTLTYRRRSNEKCKNVKGVYVC